MKQRALSKIRFYPKVGARLYIPKAVLNDVGFPFEDGDYVKLGVDGRRLVVEKAEWFDLLDWDKMSDAFAKLPEAVRQRIEGKELEQ